MPSAKCNPNYRCGNKPRANDLVELVDDKSGYGTAPKAGNVGIVQKVYKTGHVDVYWIDWMVSSNPYKANRFRLIERGLTVRLSLVRDETPLVKINLSSRREINNTMRLLRKVGVGLK